MFIGVITQVLSTAVHSGLNREAAYSLYDRYMQQVEAMKNMLSVLTLTRGVTIMIAYMDYNRYKMGKSMQGMVNAMMQFLGKFQAAIEAGLVGVLLIAVGYDAKLYENADNIPASLFSGLGLVLFAVPAILALLSVGSMLFCPLLRKSQRDQVYAEIEKHKEEVQALEAAAPAGASSD